MAVVINFDPLRRISQFEQFGELTQQFALCRAFSEAAVKRFLGVARGLADQSDALAALREKNRDLATRALGERFGEQFGLGQDTIEQDQPRRRHILIKLREKAGQHFGLFYFLRMRREKGAMPPILSAANEKCLNPHRAIFVRERKNIGIANALRVDRLAALNESQRAQPVAHDRCRFKIKRLGRRRHLRTKLGLDLGRFAPEERFGVGDQLGIARRRDARGARRGAALDLIEQARAIAV